MASGDNELREMFGQLLRALNRRDTRDKSGTGKYYHSDDEARGNGSAKVVSDFEKLRRELSYQKDAAKVMTNVSKTLKEELLGLIKPSSSLDKAFKQMEMTLRESTRKSADSYKKISLDSFNAFKGIIKSGRDFDSALKGVSSASIGFMTALEKSVTGAKEIDTKIRALLDEKENKKSEISSVTSRMRGKTDEEKGKMSGELTGKQAQLKKINDQLTREYKARDDFIKGLGTNNHALMDGINQLEKLKLQGIDLMQGINVDAIKNGKLTTNASKELNKALSQFAKNSGAVMDGAFAAHTAIPEGAKTANELMAKSIQSAFDGIVDKAIPQVMRDFSARRMAGIGDSTYGSNISNNLGMTEAERSQLVGNHKRLFNSMGNGDINGAFKTDDQGSSMMHRMQLNVLNNFGLYGKEAAEQVAKMGTSLMQSGFKPTEKNLKVFSDNLMAASVVAQQSPEVMQDFFDSMKDTGQMALVQQNLKDKTGEQQIAAIMQNNAYLMKVNNALGYNADELKKQNQAAFNAKWGGIEQAVRQQVGRSMVLNSYNAANPNDQVSKDQFALGTDTNLQQTTLNGAKTTDERAAAEKQVKDANDAAQRVLASISDTKNNAIINAVKKGSLDSAEVSANAATIGSQYGLGMMGLSGSDSEAAQQAKLNRGAQKEDNRTKGLAMQDITPERINATIDRWTKGMDATATGLIEFKTQLKSVFEDNPLGAAGGGIIGFIKGAAEMAIGQKMGTLLGSSISKVLGRGAVTAGTEAATGTAEVAAAAEGGVIASVGTKVVAWMTTGVATAGFVSITAAILGSAAVGVSIGNVIRDTWDKSDYGKKMNDVNELTANGPVEAAINKLTSMAPMLDPYGSFKRAQMANMPKDQLEHMQSVKAAHSLLDSLDVQNGQAFGSNRAMDQSIMAQYKNGNITTDDLKNKGFTQDYINSMMESMYKDMSFDDLLKKMTEIAENTKEANKKADEKENKEQARFETKTAIDAKVKRTKADAEATVLAARASIPRS